MNSTKKLLKTFIVLITVLCTSVMTAQTCTANFATTIGPNYVVTFSNTSTYSGTLTGVFWTFQNGSPFNSTSSAPTVTYAAPGTYTVTLAIFTNGPCTTTLTTTITIPAGCVASIAYTAASTPTTCNGVASVTAANVCGAAGYTWLPGGITGNPAVGLCPGIYTVAISSSGSVSGCCPFITQTVNVPSCALSPTFAYITGAAGTLNFINQSSGGTNPTYVWKFGDGNGSNSLNPSHTYAANGNYLVTLIMKDGPNCMDSIQVPVNISSYTCSASLTYSVFPNGYVQFTNTSQPQSTTAIVNFNFGNSNSVSGPGIYTTSTTYTSNGSYSVSITVTVNGCVSTSNYTVPVLTVPIPCSLTADFSSTVTAGGIVNFMSTSIGTTSNTTYFWISDNGLSGTGPTTTMIFPQPGTYLVQLDVKDSLCTSSKIDTITIANFSCNLIASFGHTVGSQGNVTFSSTSNGAGQNATFQWFFGDGTGGLGSNTFHSYANGGSHLVKLVVTSGNCKDSSILSVNITGVSCTANSGFTLTPTSTPYYWHATPFYPWNVVAAKWSWGDGTTTDSLYATHQYSFSSTYNICLSVTVSCGDTSTTCGSYYVYRASQGANTIYYVNVVPPAFKVVGMSDHAAESFFEIFPNPNDGTFFVAGSENQISPLQIRIFDVIGSEVFETKLEPDLSSSRKISAGELKKGIYFVELSQGDQKHLKKIIISP